MNNIIGSNVSVIGSTHIKNNKECQDFSSFHCTSKYGIAVVSDGHGAEKHFRSAKGSELAVSAAIEAIKEFVVFEDSFSQDKDRLLTQLEKSIILKWNNAVSKHFSDCPFFPGELGGLSDADKNAVIENVESAYGATVIALVLTGKYCFGIQIGDGDCAVLDKEGSIFNPMPTDDQLLFNKTTSLCDKAALANFRHFWLNKPPVAIVLSTDGVRNSFESENHYLDFCIKVMESFVESAYDEAQSDLKEFLHKLTAEGSGDDVSISALIRMKAATKTLENLSKNKEESGKTNENPDIATDESRAEVLGTETSVAEDTDG